LFVVWSYYFCPVFFGATLLQ